MSIPSSSSIHSSSHDCLPSYQSQPLSLVPNISSPNIENPTTQIDNPSSVQISSLYGAAQSRPFVAILTSDFGTPFGGNHFNFRDIILTGKQMGVTVFVTTPKNLNTNKQEVKGYTLTQPTKPLQWIERIFPYPDVIYNRIPSRKSEQQLEVQNVLREIRKTTPLFNPSFFDKWSLYQFLIHEKEARRYLPKTVQVQQLSDLKHLLETYSTCILKPINGKAGIGMMKITLQPNGVEMIVQQVKSKKRYVLDNLNMVWKRIKPMIMKKPYIAQQYIQLAKYKGSPFDVRMLFQKNHTGKWGLTGAGIRVAGKDSISTHVPMGGRIENLPGVFIQTFGTGRSRNLYHKLENIGLSIAKIIERKQGVHLGEMSMDMGVDTKGDVYFFEANSKPMKFDEPEIRQLSLQRIIQYCLYLSRQRNFTRGGAL